MQSVLTPLKRRHAVKGKAVADAAPSAPPVVVATAVAAAVSGASASAAGEAAGAAGAPLNEANAHAGALRTQQLEQHAGVFDQELPGDGRHEGPEVGGAGQRRSVRAKLPAPRKRAADDAAAESARQPSRSGTRSPSGSRPPKKKKLLVCHGPLPAWLRAGRGGALAGRDARACEGGDDSAAHHASEMRPAAPP